MPLLFFILLLVKAYSITVIDSKVGRCSTRWKQIYTWFFYDCVCCVYLKGENGVCLSHLLSFFSLQRMDIPEGAVVQQYKKRVIFLLLYLSGSQWGCGWLFSLLVWCSVLHSSLWTVILGSLSASHVDVDVTISLCQERKSEREREKVKQIVIVSASMFSLFLSGCKLSLQRNTFLCVLYYIHDRHPLFVTLSSPFECFHVSKPENVPAYYILILQW